MRTAGTGHVQCHTYMLWPGRDAGLFETHQVQAQKLGQCVHGDAHRRRHADASTVSQALSDGKFHRTGEFPQRVFEVVASDDGEREIVE